MKALSRSFFSTSRNDSLVSISKTFSPSILQPRAKNQKVIFPNTNSMTRGLPKTRKKSHKTETDVEHKKKKRERKASHQSLCGRDSYLIFKWAMRKKKFTVPRKLCVLVDAHTTHFLQGMLIYITSNMFHGHYSPIAAIHCDFGAFRQQHNVDCCWLSLFLSTFAGGKHNGGLGWLDVLPTNDGIGSEDFVFIFSKCSFELAVLKVFFLISLN